jgi:cellulose synthase/poly-beta-1,6-N-acetylglucosamine synthase-like glycosyltransferase
MAANIDAQVGAEKISVVVPMRNEREHIRACLDSLLSQTYAANSYEVIVIDGRSSDGSTQIVQDMQRNHPNLRLVVNPSGITPTGMNLGIQNASNRVIVIAGAHAVYPTDFLFHCAAKLRETGADVVGGPIITIAADRSFGARLVASVLSTPFGVGNSRFRTSVKEGYADTVPFGAYRLEILTKVGLFNEKLVRNQDNDLSSRIRNAGGRIYFSPKIRASYICPESFGKFLLQTYRKSQWHFFTMRQNIRALGLRHLAPAFFLISLSCLLAVAVYATWAKGVLIALLLAYCLVGLGFSLRLIAEDGLMIALCLPLACTLFHVSYAVGTLVGFRYLIVKAPSRPIQNGVLTQ